MRIAVVICTYNRAATLRDTLACMADLPCPPDCEVVFVVVNNCCVDETDAVIGSFMQRMPLLPTHEAKPGLSNARNKGVQVAVAWGADLIIWTDDDIRPYPDWLVSYAASANRHTDAAIFGGPIEPLLQSTPPRWISDNWAKLGHAYGECELGQIEVPLPTERGLPFGANFAIRSAVLASNPFDPRLGVVGGKRLAGEETVLMRALLCEGHGGWWVPAARVRHLVEPERLNLGFISRYFFGAGVSESMISAVSGRRLFGRPRWLLVVLLKDVISLVKSFLFSYGKSEWVESFIRFAFHAGQYSAKPRN